MALQPPPLSWHELSTTRAKDERQRHDDQLGHHSLLGRADVHLSEPPGGRGLSAVSSSGTVCQCRHPRVTSLYAKTDYAANAGSYVGSDTGAAHGEHSSTAADPNTTASPIARAWSGRQDIRRMSYTIFAAEKYMNSIALLVAATACPTTTAPSTASARNKPLGAAAIGHHDPNPTSNPTGERQTGQAGIADDPSYRFGSNHAAGFNTAFCDGSVTSDLVLHRPQCARCYWGCATTSKLQVSRISRCSSIP